MRLFVLLFFVIKARVNDDDDNDDMAFQFCTNPWCYLQCTKTTDTHTHMAVFQSVQWNFLQFCAPYEWRLFFFLSFILYFNMIMDWNLMHFHCIEFSHFNSWDFAWKFTRFIEFSFSLFDHISVLFSFSFQFHLFLYATYKWYKRMMVCNETCTHAFGWPLCVSFVVENVKWEIKKETEQQLQKKKRKFKFIHSICGMAKLPADYPIDQLTVASNIHRL